MTESDSALRIEVRRGDPTPEELAAVIAVVTEAYESEAATVLADDARTRNAWYLTARGLREPLRRDLGWGRFGG